MKNYAISVSTLSYKCRTMVQETIKSDLQFFTLSELRKEGIKKLLLFLRGLKANYWVICAEDEESKSLMPVIEALSLFVQAKHKIIIDARYEHKKLSITQSAFSFTRFLLATTYNLFYKKKISMELTKCLAKTADKEQNFPHEKILYINANLWYGIKAGGSVGHVAGVVNGFFASGNQVVYAAASENKMIKNAVATFILPPLELLGYPPEINYYHFSNSTVRALEKHIQIDKPHVIYQRMSIGNYAGVILSKKYNIPLILEYNGSEVWCAKNWGVGLTYPGLALLAEQVCIKHASRIVTVSQILKNELIERGVAAEKIIFYPNCVDPELFDPEKYTSNQLQLLRKEYQLDETAMVFTFVGTFGKWHGVELLAEVIVKMVEQYQPFLKKHGIIFMLVGDGAQMAQVRHILTDEKYTPYYRLTGIVPQDQAAKYLAMSDVLLSPHVPNSDGSRFFGSPTKIFEYMAMSKPIIASNLEQIGEVLADGIHIDNLGMACDTSEKVAVLCRPGNVDDIINAIVFVAENKALRENLGKNARSLVLKKYTWKQHVAAIFS